MTDPTSARLLRTWIARQASAAAVEWLDDQIIAAARSDRTLGLAISAVPRRVGKADLDLSAEDRARARLACPGWTPEHWSLDQAARVLLLVSMATDPAFVQRLQQFLATADVGETIAIHVGLPLYPASSALTALATDGLRTSMRSVFDSIAHANPFPAAVFDEDSWNQMVLKALFIETALDPIQGLDRRRNKRLAGTLLDYADERWAAGRRVRPELWRCIGPFGTDASRASLHRVLRSGEAVDRAAAALALSEDPSPEAAQILAADPALVDALRSGAFNWAMIARGTAGEMGSAA